MKRIISVITAMAAFVFAFIFTANAAFDEWAVYDAASSYKEQYGEDDEMPKVPGMKYTDSGVQMYTATEDQLKEMNTTAFGTIQTKEKVNYKNGLTMTVSVDAYTKGGADKWISFSVWDSKNINQGATGYGCGWFCLIRPEGTSCMLESWLCTPTIAMKELIRLSKNINIYDGEALILEIKPEDGQYNIYVNDVDMHASEFVQFMDNDEAYIGVSGHQGCREQIILTIAEFNGEKPAGSEAFEPYLPEELVPIPSYEETPPTPEGKPCWLWNADNAKNGVPGSGMSSFVNDDGSLHITFDENPPQISTSIKTGSYRSNEFPVFAVKFKNLDNLGFSTGNLWYCAGDVYAAQDDSRIEVNWDYCEYDKNNDDGWRLLTVDLSEELTWKDRINGFRLDISPDDSLNGESADIMWIGFFRNAKDAFVYAGMGDYYKSQYESETVTETETESIPDETESDTSPSPETTGSVSETAENISVVNPNEGNEKVPIGKIIGIVIACAAATAVVVCVIIIALKKRKKQ